MKTTAFLFLLLICAPLLSHAQASKIPSLVTNAFNTKYPTAKQVQWKEQSKEYNVTFSADGYNYEARFSENGDWKITQREITTALLPGSVRNTLSKSEFSDWSIRSTYILFLPGMITQYRVIISKGDNSKSLLFSQDAKLLKDNFTL